VNWVTITADDLKAAGHGNIMDRADTDAVGGVDPITESITNAIAEVRTAVRAGNRLDVDETKIPLSLKALTVRLIIYALMMRIGLPMSDDQQKQADRDQKRLERLLDRKLRVEPADTPETGAGPVNPGIWNSERKIIGRTHPVPPPGLQQSSVSTDVSHGYADPDPDAPEDSSV
jgi:hypothetical protein